MHAGTQSYLNTILKSKQWLEKMQRNYTMFMNRTMIYWKVTSPQIIL